MVRPRQSVVDALEGQHSTCFGQVSDLCLFGIFGSDPTPRFAVSGTPGHDSRAEPARGGWSEAGIPRLVEACESRSWYCGPPQGFIEYLHELDDAAPGIEMVNVQASMGTPQQVILEQLEWFASAVMPEFQPAGAVIR